MTALGLASSGTPSRAESPLRRFLLNYVHLTSVVILEFRLYLALLVTTSRS